jgi:Glycosyl hydrolase catalytic core/Beta-galactosidase
VTVRARAVAALCALALSPAVAACGTGPARPPAPLTVHPAPSGAPPLIVGVVANTLGAGAKMGADQTQVEDLGVHWIREELDWPPAEPRPGEYEWATFDRLLESAAAHHLHVLPLILGTPDWAGPGPLALPDNVAAFAAFVGQAAARYGPGGTFWHQHPHLDAQLAPQWFELWNEPYIRSFSTGGVDPARYAQMVVAAARAGRAADPRTKYLLEADLQYETSAHQHRNWLAALYAAEPDLNAAFDGIAVHPYSEFGPDAGENKAPLAQRFARIGAIERILVSHGGAGKPMWITELGWSTCETRPDCTSQHDQAQWLSDAFDLIRTRYASFVRAVFIYHLYDFAASPLDPQDHYGLLNLNGSPKPAWSVVHQEARFAGR